MSDSATSWTVACQASLSFTISWSLLKFMSIKSLMPSNHLILCHPLLLPPSIFPSIRTFPMSQFFASGGQSIGASASASAFPMNIQDWFPLGWTGWISLQSKGLSRVFSSATVWEHLCLYLVSWFCSDIVPFLSNPCHVDDIPSHWIYPSAHQPEGVHGILTLRCTIPLEPEW